MIVLILLGKRVQTNNVGYEELDEWKVIASTLRIQCRSPSNCNGVAIGMHNILSTKQHVGCMTYYKDNTDSVICCVCIIHLYC